MADFWSVTVYDTTLRAMIQNEQGLAGIGDPDDPTVNDDGSIDMYFGPKKPTANNSNWIQTNPDKGCFMYFRFYGPEQGQELTTRGRREIRRVVGPKKEFFDRSWVLDDLKKVK